MMIARPLLVLLLLAGCVAPEPPPPPPRPRVATPAEPRRTDLEPAPLANRALRPPANQSNINIEIPPAFGAPAKTTTPPAPTAQPVR